MRLLLAALVVGVLLVVGDRVALGLAEDRLAADMQASQRLAQRPDVQIAGVPFLTQAVRGEYDDVRVEATDVDLGEGLRAESLRAVVTGAQVPLGDVVGGAVTRVPALRVEARALLAFDDLEDRLSTGAAPALELSAAPDGAVRVETQVRALGRDLALRTDSRVTVEGQGLAVSAGRVDVEGPGGSVAESLLNAATRGRLDFTLPLAQRPFGLALREVEVTEPGLVAVAGGEDVVLQPLP